MKHFIHYKNIFTLVAKWILFLFFSFNFFSLAKAEEIGRTNFGTGFFVTDQGYILTAYHILRENDKTLVKLSDDSKFYSAEIIKVDSMLDLALLRINKSSHALKFASWDSVPIGLEVCSIGFNMLGGQGAGVKITQGLINADEGINGLKRFFQLSAEIEKGNSGGPVLSPDGLVVGLVELKLNALSVAEKIKDLPQNVNFALKSRPILRFLDTTPVHIESQSLNLGVNLRPYEILKKTQSSIVLVVSTNKDEANKFENESKN